MQIVKDFKQAITKELEMIDLELTIFFLTIQIREKQGRILSLKYAKDFLKNFKMFDCKPKKTPINTVRSCQKMTAKKNLMR